MGNGNDSDILLTDTGSRIGIIYVPTVQSTTKGELHFIINGVDRGPVSTDIPLNRAPLFVVIDVYGTTKQIRIIQLEGSKYLHLVSLNRLMVLLFLRSPLTPECLPQRHLGALFDGRNCPTAASWEHQEIPAAPRLVFRLRERKLVGGNVHERGSWYVYIYFVSLQHSAIEVPRDVH